MGLYCSSCHIDNSIQHCVYVFFSGYGFGGAPIGVAGLGAGGGCGVGGGCLLFDIVIGTQGV